MYVSKESATTKTTSVIAAAASVAILHIRRAKFV